MDYIIDELGVFFPLMVIAGLFYIASKLGSAPGLIKDRQRRLEKEKFFSSPSDISIHSILDDRYIKPREDAPLPIEIRPKVFSKTNGVCHYCNKDLKVDNEWHIEHVWPKRFDGTNELNNLVPSCVDCNDDKWAYIPPFFLFRKWVLAIPFTQFERSFISYHRNLSMSYLTNSTHLKNCCDWWFATSYQKFADLILNNPGLKSLPIKERKKQITIAQELFDDMELGKIANPGHSYRHSSYRAIEKMLENDKFQESIKKQN
jgi:hypothetical protein